VVTCWPRANSNYSGTTTVPVFNAAFRAGTVSMGMPVAANTVGQDTFRWTVVN
jgi:hypothetical protein